MRIEKDTGDRRFAESLRAYLQPKSLRILDSEPDPKQLQEREMCVYEEGGELYLAVRYNGGLKKTKLE